MTGMDWFLIVLTVCITAWNIVNRVLEYLERKREDQNDG